MDLAPRRETQQRSASPSCLQARLLEIHRQTRQLRQQRQGQQVVLAINRSDYMLDEPSSTLLQVGLLLAPAAGACCWRLLLAPCTAQHWLQKHSTFGVSELQLSMLRAVVRGATDAALLRNGPALLLPWLHKASPHQDLCGCSILGRVDAYIQQAVYAPCMTQPAAVQQPSCCMTAVSW